MSALFFTVLASTFAENTGALTEQSFAARSGPRGPTLFAVVPAAESGLTTENNYAEPRASGIGPADPRLRGGGYHEFSVGAVGTGVAIGDYDSDGRPDIFVVSKTESCRLFRNLGNWKFEDVTEKAGVGDAGDAAAIWKQGVTFVDINNDGRLDIYLCRYGAPNLLYINQGDGAFKEEAQVRGLAVNDASVMGAFCDYDHDGWLDVYVLTNLRDAASHPTGQPDYLFHNNRDGAESGRGGGTFTDVTARAGISGAAQGHSATWWDYNGDGWSDLYVANDFAAPDVLYRNNGDGTFTNVINEVMPVIPYSSMGSDLGDINNDGLVDFFVADMAATTHQKDQRTIAASRAQTEAIPDDFTGAPQFPRNTLFLNTGADHCLEAAFLTGLVATDWTWSVRFDDLDNDGYLDLHVTNGMHREVHNVDLLQRLAAAQNMAERERIERNSLVLTEQNLAYRNRGDFNFENVSAEWGLNEKGVSFGTALGDLDGDGDLDLVYTNYKKGVTLLRNDSDTGHAVIIALQGKSSNRFGVGATVRVETESGGQIRQFTLARGVLSSSEPVVHFGLGNATMIKRLEVSWPSGQIQSFADLPADRRYTISEPAIPLSASLPAKSTSAAPQFTEVSSAINLSIRSRESSSDEFGQNPLLPMRQNRRGPGVAVGDVNGDGWEDVVIGGTSLNPARLLLADAGGKFREGKILPATLASALADGPVLLSDVDGDGDDDLLLTSAGVDRPPDSADYQPRLLLNDGQGGFRPTETGALPVIRLSAGAAVAADFDRDGRLDVFMGARVLPGLYPLAPRSTLLQNRGGKFEDVTDFLAPGLREIGMVTAALWSDVDNDGWPDLLVTLEWGAVRYFHNQKGIKFEDWTERAGFAAAGTGWWNSIVSGDFNGDGQMDYAVGNLGLNTPYQASAQHPAVLFFGDFADGAAPQLVEGYYEGENLFPRRTRRQLGARIPSILKRFPRNDLYARATLGELLGENRLAAAQRFAATEFRSGVFLSQENQVYRFEPLPRLAQIAPVQGLVAGDYDGDGHTDLFLVQNSFAPAPSTGRFDGGLGLLLTGNGQGNFTPAPSGQSNLIVPGDAKALVEFDYDHDGWPDFLVTRNDKSTLVFRNHGLPGRHSLRVILQGPAGNAHAIGSRVSLELADGTRQTSEVQAGSGYYSQSSAAGFFGFSDANPARALQVRWPDGTTTTHPLTLPVTTIRLTH